MPKRSAGASLIQDSKDSGACMPPISADNEHSICGSGRDTVWFGAAHYAATGGSLCAFGCSKFCRILGCSRVN